MRWRDELWGLCRVLLPLLGLLLILMLRQVLVAQHPGGGFRLRLYWSLGFVLAKLNCHVLLLQHLLLLLELLLLLLS